MKGCRPLSFDEVERVLSVFDGRNETRDRTMFVLGINSGFRISELLSLRISDVIHNKRVRRVVEVKRRHMKRKLEGRQIRLNKHAQCALFELIREHHRRGTWCHNSFLFKSEHGKNSPITRVRAYQVLIKAFGQAGVMGKLGTHSMRKTFGNNIYDYMLQLNADGVPVDPFRETAKALGHKDIKNTENYLSFKNEHLNNAIENLTYCKE
ncbi:tyrosine-type recombinase/integrase [Halodesulfovibrio aestuarii]|uniref:Tyrosine-type recombinase/integrase n=1 Tax=Halodesulfovibrio aestuarii TaxID=126333 RepID=A0ABV4JMV8_9BACT